MSTAWFVARRLMQCSTRSSQSVGMLRSSFTSTSTSPQRWNCNSTQAKLNVLRPLSNYAACLKSRANYSTESSSVDTGSKEHIQSLVDNNTVVVFMKGIPDQPQCGFSNAVVQILRMHGVEYDSHNVLADEQLRAGIKVFSDWPTIPQIYVKGEFVGGCDILLQMHQSGDLIEELKAAGIRSALLDKEK